MKSNGEGKEENEVRMELKYCERCGGLWLRECGAGVVYCDNCVPFVEELPMPKKKARKAALPVGRRPVVDDYDYGIDGEGTKDLEAAGGVA